MINNIDPQGAIFVKQEGYYFSVSDNDALILNKYLGYKLYGVNKLKTGFPIYIKKAALQKIDNLGMNYDVVDKNGNTVVSKRFASNCYEIIDASLYGFVGVPSDMKEPGKQIKLSVDDKMKTYIDILQGLSEGCNVFTGEVISGIDDELKGFCAEMAMYFDDKLKAKERRKSTTPNQGQRWTPKDDQLLLEEYKNGKSIKELSKLFSRSSGAIRARLLKFINL